MRTKNWYIALMNIGFIVCLISFSNAGQLEYSTFIGGSNFDLAYSIAVDSIGNTYITGRTGSSDFPTTPGAYDRTSNGYADVFVTKLNSTGSSLIYSTLFGGSDDDIAYAIAIDNGSNAYITGETMSPAFPTTPNAYDTTFNGSSPRPWDVFVTKLNVDGSSIIYSTFLGGSSGDEGKAIDVDSSGNAYITGYTESTDFPIMPNAYNTTQNGNINTFVSKLNATGSALIYSTFLGGDNGSAAFGITLDNAGNTYIAGATNSSKFPVTANAFDTTFNGDTQYNDIFVCKLNATGSALIYSTFLGGTSTDCAYGIALDSADNAYITGYTRSVNFPTTIGAFDTSYNSSYDTYVSVIDATGSALIYSTFIGGTSYDYGYSIAVDNDRNAYITGYIRSANFPITSNAFDTTFRGNIGANDIFVSKINPYGSKLLYSSA